MWRRPSVKPPSCFGWAQTEGQGAETDDTTTRESNRWPVACGLFAGSEPRNSCNDDPHCRRSCRRQKLSPMLASPDRRLKCPCLPSHTTALPEHLLPTANQTLAYHHLAR